MKEPFEGGLAKGAAMALGLKRSDRRNGRYRQRSACSQAYDDGRNTFRDLRLFDRTDARRSSASTADGNGGHATTMRTQKNRRSPEGRRRSG
jgi:hypothetical protein